MLSRAILKKLLVARADCLISSFRRCISFGVPVEPDVCAEIYSESFSHSRRNRTPASVRFNLAISVQVKQIFGQNHIRVVLRQDATVTGCCWCTVVRCQDPVATLAHIYPPTALSQPAQVGLERGSRPPSDMQSLCGGNPFVSFCKTSAERWFQDDILRLDR